MEDKNILSLLGINIENQKIDIDLNKTKNFFENIQKELEKKSQAIEKSIQEGKVELKDIGLKVDKQHISLDLNKTKSFVENLTKKLDSFIKDLDNSFKDINKT